MMLVGERFQAGETFPARTQYYSDIAEVEWCLRSRG